MSDSNDERGSERLDSLAEAIAWAKPQLSSQPIHRLLSHTITARLRPTRQPPKPDRAVALPQTIASPPRTLGRYEVLAELGRGAMGIVLAGFDATLGRRVALKRLSPRHTDLRLRLQREAQALAQLSHPNVVQVFEVGEERGHTFIAMELIEGRTLQQWQEQLPRPTWADCLRAYIQAGYGLAAAHSKGLVHRDFKPGNCMIDASSVVKVLDFGLVARAHPPLDASRTLTDSQSIPIPLASFDDDPTTSITQTGMVVGTMAYMAPEAMGGASNDALSDQFSFCVSLYEAVYGERPFAGDTRETLSEAVMKGQIRPAPAGRSVPTKLRSILLRGLEVDAKRRWPSMDALLVELERRLAPRMQRWVAMGLAGGLLAAGAGFGFSHYAEVGRRCSGAPNHLKGVWDASRRQAVQSAILGTDRSYAPDTWALVAPRLDQYARAWTEKYTEVCEATSVRKEQSDEEMSLRMGCLREVKRDLSATTYALANIDTQTIQNAIEILTALPDLTRCDNIDQLTRQRQRLAPPHDLTMIPIVEDLREQMAQIRVDASAGKYAQGLTQIEPLVAQAEALDFMPVLAEALLLRGSLYRENSDYPLAERDLERAYAMAAESGHDQVVINATASLTALVGLRRSRPVEGLQWGQVALPLARRTQDPTTIASVINQQGLVLAGEGNYHDAAERHRQALQLQRSALHGNELGMVTYINDLGNVLGRLGQYREAEQLHRQALEIRIRRLGPGHPSVGMSLNNLGIAVEDQGRYEEAEELYRQSIRIREQALGPDDLYVAISVESLGIVLERQGKYDEAESQLRRALQIREQVLDPDNLQVAMSLHNLSMLLGHQGQYRQAEAYARRSLQISKTVLGATHPEVVNSLNSLGTHLVSQGQYDEAEALHRQALQIVERTAGAEDLGLVNHLTNLGTILIHQNQNREARDLMLRALRITTQELSPDNPRLAYPLLGLAELDLDEKDFASARKRAERALALSAEDQPLTAESRFMLARALWPERRERARARQLAQQARALWVEIGSTDKIHEQTDPIDRWLARHAAR